MNYEDNKNKYDNKCDSHFITKYNESYNVFFYNDDNNQKFLILENIKKKYMWCQYKLLCSYDIKNNFIKTAKDMIIIESSIIDKNLKINTNMNIKTDKDIDIQIMTQIFNYNYIGFLKKKKDNIIYYYLINKIIRI